MTTAVQRSVPATGPRPCPTPPLTCLSDAELVRLVQSGEAGLAWEEIDRRYRHRAVGLARYFLRPGGRRAAEAAEEVAHDALTAAYLNLPRCDPDRPFAPWLMACVRHAAVDWLRRSRRETTADLSAVPVESTPPQLLIDEEMRRAVTHRFGQALAALPPRNAILFLRFYCHGESVLALAHDLGLAEQTVRCVLCHTKRRVLESLGAGPLTNGQLKRFLARHCDDLSPSITNQPSSCERNSPMATNPNVTDLARKITEMRGDLTRVEVRVARLADTPCARVVRLLDRLEKLVADGASNLDAYRSDAVWAEVLGLAEDLRPLKEHLSGLYRSLSIRLKEARQRLQADPRDRAGLFELKGVLSRLRSVSSGSGPA
jgi:RNA polymerase sigma factor (sigma-70 family)